MESLPLGSTETYWATCLQIAAVFALTLVLELRFVARRWSATDRFLRRYHAVIYLVAAIAVSVAIQVPIGVLANRTYLPWTIELERQILIYTAALLALSPVLDLFLAAYSDAFLKLMARLPRSRAQRLRANAEEGIAATVDITRAALEQLEIARRVIRSARRRRKLATLSLERATSQLNSDDLAVDTRDDLEAISEFALTAIKDLDDYLATISKKRRKIERILRKSQEAWTSSERLLDEIDQAADGDALDAAAHLLRIVRGHD